MRCEKSSLFLLSFFFFFFFFSPSPDWGRNQPLRRNKKSTCCSSKSRRANEKFTFQVIFLLSLPRSGEKSVPGQPSRGFRDRLQRDEILDTEAAIATEPAGRRGGGHRPRAGVHTRPPSKEMGGDFFFLFSLPKNGGRRC